LKGNPLERWHVLLLLPVLLGGLAWVGAAADTEPKLTFVDLQSLANQELNEGMHGVEGNNLQNVPRGEQKMADTRFSIGQKLIHLRGEHEPDKPVKVEGIKVEARFDRLHILHSTGWGEGMVLQTDGAEIGAYIVHYADKTSATIPIRYGEDLRDWWDQPQRGNYAVTRAKVAWEGKNPTSENTDRHIHLFAVAWNNPHPDKQVATIDFLSNETLCDPFLLALTLEKK
jgi:hypothetical protein